MVSTTIEIKLKTGLHARPAALLVTLVKSFSSRIRFNCGPKTAKGSSIISILALGLKYGSFVEIEADGEDEMIALDQVVSFIRNLEA
jgi:phosphocarrier protein HPr